ncbi:MAG: PepSY domain-containing protein [Rhodobiaceae bacterium]|nr:PepSY domain-containing protein [Rhodobiaceae bacterium]
MLRNIILPAVLVCAMSVGAHAAAEVKLTDANTTKIRSTLTEQGYKVGKVKIEDGFYEAYVRKDGERYEVVLDGDFTVVKVKQAD